MRMRYVYATVIVETVPRANQHTGKKDRRRREKQTCGRWDINCMEFRVLLIALSSDHSKPEGVEGLQIVSIEEGMDGEVEVCYCVQVKLKGRLLDGTQSYLRASYMN